MEHAFGEGRRRWPDVQLEFALFRERCEVLVRDHPGTDPLVHPADLYLCCACAQRDRRAFELFEREGAEVARAAIRRVHSRAEFVEETLQELWQRLLFCERPGVAEYGGRGPLKAWIRVAATHLALDRARAEKDASLRFSELWDELPATCKSPESSLFKSEYAEAFQLALERGVRELSPEQRNLLRMHVVGRCSIDQIGRVLGVHRATAARWLERARESVFESARRRLMTEPHGLSEVELRSIARLMLGDVELRLTSTLRAAPSGTPEESGEHG